MPRFAPSLALLLAALLCGTAPRAQQPAPEPSTWSGPASEAQIRQWLAAPDPRLNAWAAHFILEDRRTDLLEELEKLAARLPGTGTAYPRMAEFAALDTILQLDGTLPADALVGLDDMFDAQQALLLNRLPWSQAGPAWQAIYARSPKNSGSRQQRVAAEMLARHPPAEFAAGLLREISVDLNFNVHDEGVLFGYGGSSGCCGAGFARDLKDWPAVGSYSWFQRQRPEDQPAPGSVVFLDGAYPIFLHRTVGVVYSNASGCGAGLAGLNNVVRIRLLGTMLGGASPLPEQTVRVDVSFTTREAYRQQVAGAVDSQQATFALLAAALAARGYMTEKERQDATLTVRLSLDDSRKQPAADLPAIAFRPPVTWVGQEALRYAPALPAAAETP